jgi:UDP-N-acetylmuramoyl-L-alanyl-D-glutamate--2,6-diaminopimelate ligase
MIKMKDVAHEIDGGFIMKLRDLLSSLRIYQVEGDLDTEISGIETDSRKVKAGSLFIALRGFTVDGHNFIPQAAATGAVAFVVESEIETPGVSIRLPDSRRALAILADKFYEHPTRKLGLIGVTGTNGKTTVTHLVEKILTDYGALTGIIGTIQMKIGDYVESVKNTTPESIELQHMLASMVEKGAKYACIEVSSHALEMGRVWGCEFKTAIFTNLTQDHLDYHKTMENYRNAKSLLFSQLGNSYQGQGKCAILNMDDPASEYYRKVTAAQVITYGIDHDADVQAKNIEITGSGTSFTLSTFQGEVSISIHLIGKFNVYNCLAAAAACLVEGVPLSLIKKSLESIEGVSGRFERVNEGQNYTVIVDYAHTPDSLENVLKTAKEFTKGKLYCIVGCGGDRDRTKRPVMAQIAVKYADFSVFTSDNPRSEDPDAILEDMVAGLNPDIAGQERFVAITDRRKAIQYAISLAAEEDCILIAGKGHETYQIINGQILSFDDREVASVAIRSVIK